MRTNRGVYLVVIRHTNRGRGGQRPPSTEDQFPPWARPLDKVVIHFRRLVQEYICVREGRLALFRDERGDLAPDGNEEVGEGREQARCVRVRSQDYTAC